MPRVKLFNENDVLEKAMNLFWKKGYDATSIQDLVNHLGINRASLYDTFEGKKELFAKVFLLYRETNSNGLKQFLSSQDDIKLGFSKLFIQVIEQSKSDIHNKGCFVVNTTIEFIPNDFEMIQVL
jgi:TetR/AcrR family transcriptional repressor of nem operon